MLRQRGMPSSDAAQFDALAKILNSTVLLLDCDKNLEFASSNAHTPFGLTNIDELKRSWHECYARLQLPDLLGLDKNSKPLCHQCELRTAKSTRLLQMDVYPLRRGDCECYVILLNDRQVLDGLQLQLMLASHYQVQRHLTSALAHDLNGPINTMRITLELMDRMPSIATFGAPSDFVTQWNRYKGIVRQELEKLKAQVADIPKSFVSVETAPVAMFDIRDVIKDVARFLKHEATSKNIQLELLLPDNPLTTMGHLVEIRLAVYNLARGLIEIKNPGGRLQIHAFAAEAGLEIVLSAHPTQLNKQAIDGSEQVTFELQENDVGLFVARRIVEAHGGEVQVTAADEDQCARIHVSLPLSIPHSD